MMSHSALNRLNDIEENLRQFDDEISSDNKPMINNILPRINITSHPHLQEEQKENEGNNNRNNDNKVHILQSRYNSVGGPAINHDGNSLSMI
mmetsp:Transcript_4766/g.4022  ORF Transcript_4766/g.4022 Transcript_4766/m.4022 type:complete len:92 (-) Transcript_4766:67-342(-)